MTGNEQRATDPRSLKEMDSYKLAVKFFLTDSSAVKPEDFVPTFHRWIQQKSIPNHVLIDVVDYAHVLNGPGTVLVAHEANFSTDQEGGHSGLLYVRKQPFVDAASFTDRLRRALKAVLGAAQLIEQDLALAGRAKFRTDNPILRIYDRLLAPNTPETLAAVRPQVQALFDQAYGSPVTLAQNGDAKTLFELGVTATSSPSASELLARL